MEYEVYVVADGTLPEGKGWVIVREHGRSSMVMERHMVSGERAMCETWAAAWKAAAAAPVPLAAAG